MEDLKELVNQRDEIEKELQEVTQELEPYLKLNYDKNLIDREGFPREDLDFGKLQEYRRLKKKQSELLFEFKKQTKTIEKELYAFHQNTKEEAEQKMKEIEEKKSLEKEEEEIGMIEEVNSGGGKMEMEEIEGKKYEPFCKITEVKINSPADKGGLRPGDLIVVYGKVNFWNHGELKKMIEETKNNVGEEIPITVLRKGLEVELVVTPGEWEGQGILGCRFELL